jgi:hypothetical protein
MYLGKIIMEFAKMEMKLGNITILLILFYKNIIL